jgi:hypothetical protein
MVSLSLYLLNQTFVQGFQSPQCSPSQFNSIITCANKGILEKSQSSTSKDFIWRHDIQHNDTQHNDIQHNETQHDDIQNINQ